MASFAKSINVPFNKKMLSKVFFITKRKHPSKKSTNCNQHRMCLLYVVVGAILIHFLITSKPGWWLVTTNPARRNHQLHPRLSECVGYFDLNGGAFMGLPNALTFGNMLIEVRFLISRASLLLDGPAVEVAHSTECALMWAVFFSVADLLFRG